MDAFTKWLGRAWKWIKKAGKWLKDNPWAIIVALGSVLGAVLLWKSTSNSIGTLDDAVQVRAAAREIARKEARAQALAERADVDGKEVQAIRQEIIASKKRVLEIHNAEPLEGKTDEEIAAAFTAAGF